MADSGISLHLSKADAEKRAKELAQEFMSRQDTRGYAWTLTSASPDVFTPGHKGRKIAAHWIVLVEYSRDESVSDGPIVLHVNIADGSVAFRESP